MNARKSSLLRGEHTFAINLMQHLVVPTFVIDRDCRVIIWNPDLRSSPGSQLPTWSEP